MASITQSVDYETAAIVAEDLGFITRGSTAGGKAFDDAAFEAFGHDVLDLGTRHAPPVGGDLGLPAAVVAHPVAGDRGADGGADEESQCDPDHEDTLPSISLVCPIP